MILITTFMVAGVLFVLSGAYIIGTLSQSQSVQRQVQSLQAFYAAERGVEYAFVEAKNSAWNWYTHRVEVNDEDGDGVLNELIPLTLTPNTILKNSSNVSYRFNNISHCYEIPTTAGIIEVKAYEDPQRQSEMIILSRLQGASRVIKYRIKGKSLYDYFFFFPTDQTFGKETYDGGGVGGIHVNGNILLQNTRFTNMKELSSSDYISYYNKQYTSPYWVDKADGTLDGKVTMRQYDYPPYNYYIPTASWDSISSKEYNITDSLGFRFSSGAVINEISLPKELDVAWGWDKYNNKSGNNLEPTGITKQGVEIIVPNALLNGNSTDYYWTTKYGSTPSSAQVNLEWWENKIYGDVDYANGQEEIEVKYTNSQYQPEAWSSFVRNNGLEAIVTEKNTGGKPIDPPNIEVQYKEIAKSSGLYIGSDSAGNTEIRLNGVKITNLPCWAKDNVEFFNITRPTRDGSGNPVIENVIEFDVAAFLRDCPTMAPSNNIIYVDNKDLRLVNAQKLPDGGLTVISPYNVYLKGDYNTDLNWQPAAVITNSLVYTLSNDFNDPQTMPMSSNYKNYPYSLEFSDFIDSYAKSVFTNLAQANGWATPGDAIHPEEGLNPAWIREQLSPQAQKTLRDAAENKYDEINLNNMANKVTANTVYNTAIVSPSNIYPQVLERWQAERLVTGAFIKLETPWTSKSKIPADYYQGLTKGWGGSSYRVTEPTSNYSYETNFVLPGRAPAGDLIGGTQARWEEVSDFDHHISDNI